MVGRFINADGLVSTGQGILGNNMFAYCANNPISRLDSTGQAWWHVALTCLGVAAVAALVVVAAPVVVPVVGTAAASSIATGAFALGTAATVVGLGAATYGATEAIPRTYSSSKSKTPDKNKSKIGAGAAAAAIAGNDRKQNTKIYRYGGTNPGNLTPRQKDATTGLSFSTIPPPPGHPAAVTTIAALNSTGVVIAYQDGPTHISVVPSPGMGTLQDWIDTGSSHPCTFAVQTVVVKWDGGF